MKLKIDIDDGVLAFFHAWDEKNDYHDRSTEEFAEAIVAMSHWKRNRIGIEELKEELADVIIAAVHVANSVGVAHELNAAIDKKLAKGVATVPWFWKQQWFRAPKR